MHILTIWIQVYKFIPGILKTHFAISIDIHLTMMKLLQTGATQQCDNDADAFKKTISRIVKQILHEHVIASKLLCISRMSLGIFLVTTK